MAKIGDMEIDNSHDRGYGQIGVSSVRLMDSSLLLFNEDTRRIHFKGFGDGTLEQIGINDKREKLGTTTNN